MGRCWLRALREQRPAPAAQLRGLLHRGGRQLPRRWGGQEAHRSLCGAYERSSYFYLGYAACIFPEIDALLDFGGDAAYGIGIYLANHATAASKPEHASHDA